MISDLSQLNKKYVVVPADKAPNNIVFICKQYYYQCIIKELGINSTTGNPTYTRTDLSKEEILANHRSVLQSFDINVKEVDLDLPSLYWIPKLHKIHIKKGKLQDLPNVIQNQCQFC